MRLQRWDKEEINMKDHIMKYVYALHGEERKRYALRYVDYREGLQNSPPAHDNTVSDRAAWRIRLTIDILFDCPLVGFNSLVKDEVA